MRTYPRALAFSLVAVCVLPLSSAVAQDTSIAFTSNTTFRHLFGSPAVRSALPTGPRAARQSDDYAEPLHEKFATFISGDGFESQLLVQNLQLKYPVTVTPVLLMADGEISLDPVRLAPHTSTNIDIDDALKTRGHAASPGAVVLRYHSETYGSATGVVTSENEEHHLYLSSVARSHEEYWYGTTLEAVIWTPRSGTEGYIAVSNTASAVRL